MNSEGTPNTYIKGRGAQLNPANRFAVEAYAIEHPEAIDDWEKNKTETSYYQENGKTILNKITSPDIPLSYSLNPYQGCEHGCVYCYARNSHEYWGFSAGLDFESKIVIKKRAPELLREMFSSKKWQCVPISLSGNTDCYQPIERKLGITRKLLEVCLEYRNPVGIITKNALVLRDADILQELYKHNLVSVYTSITSMDEDLRRKLEPRTSKYEDRIKIIEQLSKLGIHCGVMNAPIIPGLNDTHMFEVLRRASLAGAQSAGYTMVRLNGAIGPIFKDWLSLTFPDRAQKVWNMIADTHGGNVNDSRFETRMKGEGNLAEMIEQQFKLYCRQFHLNENTFTYNTDEFIRLKPGQLRLF
ncbi:MAG: PA0069 family radical SAM protein [Bacteroidetes bacterium]|nr:PA0069 family radical SAM protein [Bacteroidota bacterium]